MIVLTHLLFRLALAAWIAAGASELVGYLCADQCWNLAGLGLWALAWGAGLTFLWAYPREDARHRRRIELLVKTLILGTLFVPLLGLLLGVLVAVVYLGVALWRGEEVLPHIVHGLHLGFTMAVSGLVLGTIRDILTRGDGWGSASAPTG